MCNVDGVFAGQAFGGGVGKLSMANVHVTVVSWSSLGQGETPTTPNTPSDVFANEMSYLHCFHDVQ